MHPPTHTHNSPVNMPHQSGPFVTISDLTLIHHHPKSIVCIWAHSWCCTCYGFHPRYNDITSSTVISYRLSCLFKVGLILHSAQDSSGLPSPSKWNSDSSRNLRVSVMGLLVSFGIPSVFATAFCLLSPDVSFYPSLGHTAVSSACPKIILLLSLEPHLGRTAGITANPALLETSSLSEPLFCLFLSYA